MGTPEKSSLENSLMAIMRNSSKTYWLALTVCILLALGGLGAGIYSLVREPGATGLNQPVFWGVLIVNYVFWAGIAQAGILISALFYFFRARFRPTIQRIAEALAVIAGLTAALFPIIDLGRPAKFPWLFPLVNQRRLQVNFQSPLTWDALSLFAVLFTGLLLLYVGLIPDLAVARRYSQGWRARLYRALSFGWAGTVDQWRHYRKLSFFVTALAAALAGLASMITAWVFSLSAVPAWHSTIQIVDFAAGALFSGIAMVLIIAILLRKTGRLESWLSRDHLDKISQILLLTSLLVSYSFVLELVMALYYSGGFNHSVIMSRFTGEYKYLVWLALLFNSILPLSLFFGKLRRNLAWLFILSLFAVKGIWIGRFLLVATSLGRGYLPNAWGTYHPSGAEMAMTLGGLALFATLSLIFVKLLPALAISRIKENP